MMLASPRNALSRAQSVKKMSTGKIIVPLALLFALSLAVWSVLAYEGEHHSPGGNGQPNDAPLAAMSNTPCVNGMAGSRPNPARTVGVDTCSDRVQNSSGLFVGRGLHVVDIRNPAAPAFAGCVDDDGYVHETECVVYRMALSRL
jgi:hypothetical protein